MSLLSVHVWETFIIIIMVIKYQIPETKLAKKIFMKNASQPHNKGIDKTQKDTIF